MASWQSFAAQAVLAACCILLKLCIVLTASGTPGDYSVADLLVVFPTSARTLDYIAASRAWRKGVRTHIVMDASFDLTTLRRTGAVRCIVFAGGEWSGCGREVVSTIPWSGGCFCGHVRARTDEALRPRGGTTPLGIPAPTVTL